MSIFSRVQTQVIPRHTFNLSHRNLLSLNQGTIVPIFCEETVPGDKWKISQSTMLRYASLLAPVMSDAYVSTLFFYVPWYQIWDDYKTFETGGDEKTAASEVNVPTIGLTVTPNANYCLNGSLFDYLGCHIVKPASGQAYHSINALPFRAYQHIYNNWFRDENMTDNVDFSKGSGEMSVTDDGSAVMNELFKLRTRAWEKDYFTSALPWTQKGSATATPVDVTIPYMNVGLRDQVSTVVSKDTAMTITNEDQLNGVGTWSIAHLKLPNGDHLGKMTTEDGATGTGTLQILELYRTIALQKFRQISAVAGTRINEFIKGHFGVRIDDQSLDIPQFIGGSRQPVVISEVLQTAEGAGSVGQQYGHAISVGGDVIKHYCKDRGYIIGVMCVQPRTYYGQGSRRMFNKSDRYDFYYPEFANIGEQEIQNQELYNDTGDKTTFGYTPRYAEYKFIPSGIHGDFLSSLSYWHQGRLFSSQPQLNENFIKADPTNRIFAVEEQDTNQKLYALINFKIKAKRSMPYFGTPHI